MKYIKTFEAKKSTEEPLIQAAKRGSVTKVKELLKSGVDINIRSKNDRRTALMNATLNSYLAVVMLLVESPKVDVNLVDMDGRTALMMSSTKKISNILLDAGTDVNIRNYKGETCVMESLNYIGQYKGEDFIEMIERHLVKGLDLNIRNVYDMNFYDKLKEITTVSKQDWLQSIDTLLRIEIYMDEKFPQYKEEWDFKNDIKKYNL